MNKIKVLPLSLLMVAASVWAGEETEMERQEKTKNKEK